MIPKIIDTKFGSITVNNDVFHHDIIIRLDGRIKKRKKKLSKKIYGTSHTVSLDEARYIYETGAKLLIIGSGQYGSLNLSAEAKSYLEDKLKKVEVLPTGQAIHTWNKASGKVIGMFHLTC